ncbi:MAG: NRAMP family divalent metal transporter [Thermoanaerobaculia bacterium]
MGDAGVKRVLSVVFWSVIAAAFIGPGTVTTSGTAGAAYGTALLWALGFSTVATLVLQEASARLTAVSGRDLAQALRDSYHGGARGGLILVLVLGAVLLGNAAYQAGNLLGAAAGAGLVLGLPSWSLALGAGGAAGLLLWLGAPRTVAHALAFLVALMGVAFLVTAALVRPDPVAVAAGLLVPSIPEAAAPAGGGTLPSAGLLVLGLVGTTVVPYNLFLGSGLAAGRQVGEIRFGLSVAVVLGGIISMGVVLVGAASGWPFDFGRVAETLAEGLGPWAAALFGWGLAAAGLSSAVTAPLAAALAARGLFGDGPDDPRWSPRSPRYRAVWGGVLLFGVAFGVSGVSPVPAIVLAQAFNGVLLPVAAVFLFLAINDRRLLGGGAVNGPLANAVAALVVAVTVVLGTAGVLRAAWAALGRGAPDEGLLLAAGAAAVLALAYPVGRAVARRRRREEPAAEPAAELTPGSTGAAAGPRTSPPRRTSRD